MEDGSSRGGPIWESSDRDIITRFFTTVRDVLLEPGRTFSEMRLDGGFKSPLIFVFISWVIVWAAGFLLAIMVKVPGGLLQQGMPADMKLPGLGSSMITVMIFVAVAAFVMLLLFPLCIFLGAGFAHLMLLLVGGATKPFEATFRVFCYVSGATTLLSVVPYCGAPIGGIWSLVAAIIGYMKVHEISGFRSTIAVLLPMVLCCFCGILLLAGVVYMGVMGDYLQQFAPHAANV